MKKINKDKTMEHFFQTIDGYSNEYEQGKLLSTILPIFFITIFIFKSTHNLILK